MHTFFIFISLVDHFMMCSNLLKLPSYASALVPSFLETNCRTSYLFVVFHILIMAGGYYVTTSFGVLCVHAFGLLWLKSGAHDEWHLNHSKACDR